MTQPIICAFDGFDDYGSNNAAITSRFYAPYLPGNVLQTAAGPFGGVQIAALNGANLDLPMPLPSNPSSIVGGRAFTLLQ